MLISIFTKSAFSQNTTTDIEIIPDSTFIETDEDIDFFEEVSGLNPERSALLSAVLPGVGQIYNRQYWKVPIIYGGLVTFAHFINYNNDLYHALRNASIANQNGLRNPFSEVVSDQKGLIRNRNNFRRSRDYLIILGTAFYLLNIVDAHVSAHLDEFNVNEDLALSIEPSVQHMPAFIQAVGASLVVRF